MPLKIGSWSDLFAALPRQLRILTLKLVGIEGAGKLSLLPRTLRKLDLEPKIEWESQDLVDWPPHLFDASLRRILPFDNESYPENTR